VNADGRTVDHLHFAAMSFRHGVHQAIPDARFAPAIEAIVGSRVRAITLRQISPGRPRSQHPKDAIHHAPVVPSLGTRTPLRQNRFDHAPLEIREVVAHDASSAVCELESLFGLGGNGLARGSELWSVLWCCYAVGSIMDGGFNVLGNGLQVLR
jgi:hypothetical protein